MDLIVDLIQSSTLAATTVQQPCYLQKITIYIHVKVFDAYTIINSLSGRHVRIDFRLAAGDQAVLPVSSYILHLAVARPLNFL